MRMITAEEIERFWADGVVYLPNLLDAREFSWLAEGLRDSMATLPTAST